MKNLIYVSLLSLLCFACEKDEPEIPNEAELITTVIYTLTPDSGTDKTPVVMKFYDADGEGQTAPTITAGKLKSNTKYTGKLRLLDDSKSPAEEITEEIEEEDEDHQFFYKLNGLNATIKTEDVDGNGKPVGLRSLISTGDPSKGKLTITLLHEPDKSASGVAGGDPAKAGGETDIEVTFDVVIE